MSTVVERIGQYAADLRFEDMSPEVLDYAKHKTGKNTRKVAK